MLPSAYHYPAFFSFDPDGISISFPDLPGCYPCAHSEEEAFRNAREALGLHLYGLEKDGDPIPAPTPVRDLVPPDGEIAVMVDVFMPPIRERQNTRVVKKTLTLPAWLNAEAEAARVNFSQVLQEGLKSYLSAR